MDAQRKAKLKINLSTLHKMASAWFMAAGGALGSLWLALPVEQQQAVVAHLWFPAWAAPIALTAGGLIARAWPQHGITKSEAIAKSADVPQPPDTKAQP